MQRFRAKPVQVVLTPQKKKPRGIPGAPQLRKYHFKKGQSGNPGGKPKVFQKFAAMLTQQLLEPCPVALARQLGLKRGANYYDAMIAAQITNAAIGDNVAFMTVHDIIEGRLPQKNVNLSVSAEAFLRDPGFQQFLQENHKEYLDGRAAREITGPALPEVSEGKAETGN
jgi:hypothetical protein